MYSPSDTRYDTIQYQRSGRSGLQLPAISLGLWHSFGGVDTLENGRAMLRRAFDLGITHFDLANNYGPPPGSAEDTFGRILREDLAALPRRVDHLHQGRVPDVARPIWRLGLAQIPGRQPGPEPDAAWDCDYVDIFYHHRPDPSTPLEETMGALDQIVRSGQGAVCRHLVIPARAYPPAAR